MQTVNSLATLSVSFFCLNVIQNVQRRQELCLLKHLNSSVWLNAVYLIHTVGGWFLPGQSPICPSSSPPQFTGTAGHSSGSYCERYSSLRNHRAAPYPSHYSHRTPSTSKTSFTYAYCYIYLNIVTSILNGRTGINVWVCFISFSDNYMDNTSGTLPTHDSWSALQIPNSTGMGTLPHTTNSTSNSRWASLPCLFSASTTHL